MWIGDRLSRWEPRAGELRESIEEGPRKREGVRRGSGHVGLPLPFRHGQHEDVGLDRALARDQGPKTFLTRITPSVDETGEIVAMCGVPADIAEHKKPERRDDAIFNQTSELTWMLEPDGTIVVANRAALAFGVPAGQWR